MIRAGDLKAGGHAAFRFDSRAHVPDQAMLRASVLGHGIGSAPDRETGKRGELLRAMDLGSQAVLEPAALRRIGSAVGLRTGRAGRELKFLLHRRRD